jgi:tetratricopeptide (TPR) repeat protein
MFDTNEPDAKRDDPNGLLCPGDQLDGLVAQLHHDDDGGLAKLADLLRSWPLDPRLHFLHGSVLAGLQRYDEGRRAMARAVEIAPDYALARFQLGFLDLTSGRALDAVAVWTPLVNLPEDEPLRLLAEGLMNLASDRFSEARRLLARGMELNTAIPLINADMQLILDQIADLPDAALPPGHAPPPPIPEETPTSAVDLLLQQSRLKGDSGMRH